MTKLTEGNWGRGARKARYRSVVDDATAERMARYGISLEFDAISVGNHLGQVALLPLDNECAEMNALLICNAKPLLDAATRFTLKMLEIGRKAQAGQALDAADGVDLAHIAVDMAAIVAKFRPEILL